MSFWTWLRGEPPGDITPNENGPDAANPGEVGGLEVVGDDTFDNRQGLPFPVPSGWDGWPVNDWATPNWSPQAGIRKLVDAAWACIDLNANVLASMPVYRMKNGAVMPSTTWMTNPDPMIYASWQEFARQLFWDFMLGETFVMPMAHGADGYPIRFRVLPPWLVNVEMRGGRREYTVGGEDETGNILHIRYASSTIDAHGHGPLEMAGARMTLIGLLQRYATHLAETGGVPLYWIGLERKITKSEGRDLLAEWVESRTKNIGHPAILGGGSTLNQANSMNANDMALLELNYFNEARIAVLLGVPPFLVGLPGAAGSLTYSNMTSLLDFHDRSSLRPKADAVMSAMSGWSLPSGQSVELNRDDYTRPELAVRAAAYKIFYEAGILSREEIRMMERFTGSPAAVAITGGTVTGTPTDTSLPPLPPKPAAPTPPTNGRPG